MEYANILNALNAGNTTLPSANSTMEDINRKTENYKLVDKLNNEGISLKDLLNQIDELKKKVEGMETPRENIDAGVFLAMESAVENDPEVIKAREHMDELRKTILLELCMKDPRYAEAYRDYRAKVSERYVHAHSETSKTE